MIMARPMVLRITNLVSLTTTCSSHIVLTLGFSSFSCGQSHYYSNTTENLNEARRQIKSGRWLALPPFTTTVNGSALGKILSGSHSQVSCGSAATPATTTTALKWVIRCCPELPKSFVQKLFRLRKVRRESASVDDNSIGAQAHEHRLKRVAAKDTLNSGDRIFLPVAVKETPAEKPKYDITAKEMDFIHRLVLYKDPTILVLNKPPGMPVQGGINIRQSLDEVAATCLSYDYSETPRLVHRLDRDCSGILVMGRTHTSATVLHSIFREKTSRASDEIGKENRILQRRYWALVIGCPRRPKGLITAPLGKLVIDNGKSDRITIIDNSEVLPSQHAITEYQVIGLSSHGFTWLELSPLTGRKHQLRVHCAEMLGTPIVGDYRYGWHAHRKWKPLDWPNVVDSREELPKEESLPFGLNLNKGSISEEHPRLHLHCKQIVMPNISEALQKEQSASNYDLSQVESLELVAPMPPYMQRSWDIINS